MARNEFSKTACSVDGCDRVSVGRGWCRVHYNRWHRHGSPTGGGTPKRALEAWIRENADHSGEACLKWPFHRKSSGVASCKFRGAQMNAARAMCIEAHGEPPSPQHDAAHSCGRAHESCVNPNHLRWATKKENQADREKHGTVLRGDKNPASKLTDQEVFEILSLRGSLTQRVIAEKFGVSRQHVGNIFSGFRRRSAT